MNALELKNEILRMVIETDDPDILARLIAMFKEMLKKEEWAEAVSEEEAQKIEIGAAEAKSGRVIPMESVFEQANLILNKRVNL